MKKKKLLCTLSFCTFVVASFTSCNTEAVETSENELSETMKEDAQLVTFLNSIDSINNVYTGNTDTRISKDKFRKWGWRTISAMVDGSMGCVGGAATGGFGGFLIGTASSWAFDEYIAYLHRKGLRAPMVNNDSINNEDIKGRTSPTTTLAFAPIENRTLLDSLGYIHNQVMADLAYNNKTYVYSENNIDYTNLLQDCSTYLLQYNVDCSDIMNSPFMKRLFISLTRTCVDSFIQYEGGVISYGECYNNIENALRNIFGVSTPYIELLRDTQWRLMQVVPEISTEQLCEYAEDVSDIIDTSNLSEEQRNCINTIYDASINSALYWKEVNE